MLNMRMLCAKRTDRRFDVIYRGGRKGSAMKLLCVTNNSANFFYGVGILFSVDNRSADYDLADSTGQE